MNGQSVAAALEAEHHEIDAGLAAFDQQLAGGSWNTALLHDAATALRRHIYIEEEFLFPALRELGMHAPVVVMLREHGEIWRVLDTIEQGGEQVTSGSARQAYVRLASLLDAHNEKEEQILYPAADSVLDDAELFRLNELITSGALPAGWVCAHASSTESND